MKRNAYFEYCQRVPIISGHTALEQIPALLSKLEAEKPLIITDSGVAAAGLTSLVRSALGPGLQDVPEERDVPPDSDLETVRRIAGFYRKEKCDSIIAVGGGSVLDTAKGVNILVSENSFDLRRFYGSGKLTRKLNPLVAVPTTSGTGSEVTLVAVIADHEHKRKLLFTSYVLLPDAAVLDSRMTLSLPPALTASTGMDALTHAVEAYICLGKNLLSDAQAFRAIKMISENLLESVKNPSDKDLRLALAEASNLAGMAFSNSMVGMVHTLGHSVGGVCGVPHGTCMSILLPYGLEYNIKKVPGYISDLLLPLAGETVYKAVNPEERPRKVIEHIRGMNEELHKATGGRHFRCLKEITDREGRPMVPRETLPAIAETAMGDGSILYNPEELSYNEALKVLEAAWDGFCGF